MKGSPAKLGTISGTAGHSSALKMKAEADAASALKQKESSPAKWDWPWEDKKEEVKKEVVKKEEVKKEEAPKLTKHGTKTYKTAYGEMKEDASGGRTDKYGKTYKSQKEFNKAADDWWASEAGQKRAKTDKKFSHRIIKKEAPVTEDKTKVKPTKQEKAVIKHDKTVGEAGENLSKRTTQLSRRDARKKYGRGSKEHLAAKQAHLKAKEADRQGEQGGKKQGIFRKASSKINLARQKKNQAKIDALEKEEK